jgi:hypothetical protein
MKSILNFPPVAKKKKKEEEAYVQHTRCPREHLVTLQTHHFQRGKSCNVDCHAPCKQSEISAVLLAQMHQHTFSCQPQTGK